MRTSKILLLSQHILALEGNLLSELALHRHYTHSPGFERNRLSRQLSCEYVTDIHRPSSDFGKSYAM